jgi:hypothetical protein
MNFLREKWGDLIGLFLIILATVIACYALHDDPKMLAAYAFGMANGGYVALKLRTPPPPNGNLPDAPATGTAERGG